MATAGTKHGYGAVLLLIVITTNVAVLPLYFLSGVFIPETEIPDGVLKVAVLFPIRHFFEAFFTAGIVGRSRLATLATCSSPASPIGVSSICR